MQVVTHADVLARFAHALSDQTRARVMLSLVEAPAYPADLADTLGVSRQALSNHLACLRGCGLVVAVPEGRRTRYELADARLRHAIDRSVGRGARGRPERTAPQRTTRGAADGDRTQTRRSAVADRRRVLSRRIRFLVAATIAYNVIEAVVAITAGTIASSSALVGFGLDSVIEVASAVAVAWQFSGVGPTKRGNGPRCG